MSDYLPHEVFLEILLRLPAKSLVRFRSLSKSCNSIITNPDFITTHLHRPSKNDLFLVKRYSMRSRRDQYSLYVDNGTLDKYLELNFPFEIEAGFFQIIGYCNGLVCLVVDIVYYTRKVILWNPSIRKSVILPAPWSCDCRTSGPYVVAVGFGFDSRTNDYKVVRILNLPRYGTQVEEYIKESIKVQLYSLATNSWKSITSVVPYCQTFGTGAFTNENFHWLAHYVRDDDVSQMFILSFDMRDEVFREIMIPQSPVRLATFEVSLSVLGNSLCLLQSKFGTAYSNYHLWVMREYGVAESWTKQFSIDRDNRTSRLLGFRNNGDLLHQHSSTGELVLQTLESKEIKYLRIQSVSILKPFVESLVLINLAIDADSGEVMLKKRKSRGMLSQGEVGPSKAPRKGMEISDLPSQMVMDPTDGGVIQPFSLPRPDLRKGYPLPSEIQHISRDTENELFRMVEGLKMMLIKAKKQAQNALIQCKSEKDVQAQLEAWIQDVEQRIEQLLTVNPPLGPPSGVGTSWHPTPNEKHVSSETRDKLPGCSYRGLKTSLLSSWVAAAWNSMKVSWPKKI